jgi:hypothetical protein
MGLLAAAHKLNMPPGASFQARYSPVGSGRKAAGRPFGRVQFLLPCADLHLGYFKDRIKISSRG